jgi:hypothetical protein
MPHRIHVGRSLRVLACAGALVFTRSLVAQEPRVVITNGSGFAFGMTTIPISDDALKTMIQAHLPEELQQSDARHIVIVVDANGQYVSSKAGKATVVTHEGNSGSFVIGDSTGANAGAVVIRRNGSAANEGTVTAFQSKIESSDLGGGILGTGYTMADVAAIGMRRFNAGELGTGLLVVSVVKLKS